MEGFIVVGAIFLTIVIMVRRMNMKKVPTLDQRMSLWEILVPASSKKKEFTYEHHKKWDEYVKNISGGLTILRTAKGEWLNPDGELFVDRVIPVRIKCTKRDIKKIIDFTIEHYLQEAVMAYRVSDRVIIKYRDNGTF